MKINKKSFSKKPFIITVVILLVVASGYGAYAAANTQWPFQASTSQNQAITSSSSKTTDGSQKSSEVDSTKQPSGTTEDSPKTPAKNEGSSDLPKNQINVTITSISTHDGIVKVKSLINDIVSNGTCTLTFEKGDDIITKTSGIQPMPGSSTCKGFNIPVSELGKGTWQVKLSVTTDEKAGSASQSYKVQ